MLQNYLGFGARLIGPGGPFPNATAEEIGLFKKREEARYRFVLDPTPDNMKDDEDASRAYNVPLMVYVNVRNAYGSFQSFKLAMEQYLARKAS